MSNTERNMTPGVKNNWVLPCRKLSGHQVMLSSNSQPHIVPKLIFGRDVGHDGLAVVLRGLNARQRTLRPPESPTLLVLQLVDNGDAIET